MAKMYPEVFPGMYDQNNPEFIVYQTLRMLPETYVVLYSKRLKGGLFGKPECEIDFIIFNQRDVIICMEVKGGILSWRRPNSRVTGRHFKYPAHYQSKVDTHAHEPQMLTPNKISLFPPGYSFLAVGRFLFDK